MVGCLAEAPLNSHTAPQFHALFTNETFSLVASGVPAGETTCLGLSSGSTTCSCVVLGKLSHHPVPQFPHLPNGMKIIGPTL